MNVAGWIEWPLRHERFTVGVLLGVAIAGAWVFVLTGAGTGMSVSAMTSLDMALGAPAAVSRAVASGTEWTVSYAATMAVMWWVMMAAMMLPSAAPMILLHAQIGRGTSRRSGVAPRLMPTLLFGGGYLLMWGCFSVVAAAFQWGLERAGLLSPFMMNGTSFVFAGCVLLYAGLYQISPLKRVCLKHCQSPLQFLSHSWQDGDWGAFRMGLRHGGFCLGCCAGLMAILFFGGIMNLYWIIGLAILVAVEKLSSAGPKLSALTGYLLIAWSGVFFLQALA